MSQRDALVIESGVLDAEFLINDQTLTTSVKMSGLKLAKNANSERDDILFIPVDRLIDYVNRESQNLELTFELDQQGFQTSDDLDALGGEVWDGLWKAVLRKAVLVDKEDLGKQIKGKIGDFLNKARKPCDLPPSNESIAWSIMQAMGRNRRRAHDATRQEAHGGTDHWQAPRSGACDL